MPQVRPEPRAQSGPNEMRESERDGGWGLVLYIHRPRPPPPDLSSRLRVLVSGRAQRAPVGETLEAEYPEKTQTIEQEKGAKGGKGGKGRGTHQQSARRNPMSLSLEQTIRSAHDLAHAIELPGATALLTPSLRLKDRMEPWQLSSLACDGV